MGAVWTADGKQIVHGTSWGGREGVYSLSAGGGETERLLLKDGGQYAVIPEAVVPSSGQVIFGRSGGLGGYSVLTFTPGDDAPKPLLVSPSVEGGTTLSPDGKRFIMSRRPDDESIPREIDVITNFAATFGG